MRDDATYVVDTITQLRAEVERLRAVTPDRFYEIEAWGNQQKAEIERLRAFLNAISHLADDMVTMGCDGYDHEQLRMAVAIARRALEPKS